MTQKHEHLTFAHQLTAAVLSALFLGMLELTLLPEGSSSSDRGAAFFFGLAALLVGNFLPYVSAAVASGAALGWLFLRVRAQWSSPRLKLAGLVAILASPYAFFIGSYTWSGPRVRDLAYQPALVALTVLLLCLATWVLTGAFLTRLGHRRQSTLVAVSAAIVASLAGFLNLWVLPNEYEPLHTLLSLVAVVMSAFGAFEVARSLPRVPSGLGGGAASVLIVGWALGSQVVLSRNAAYGWLVTGEGAVARYLAWDPSETETSASASGPGKPEKPLIADPGKERRARAVRSEQLAPHIVVFSIDNLQADRVGAYGYDGNPSTPNIDRIAKEGVIFKRAYTLFPGTRVFLSSMLTGRRVPNFRAHVMPREFQDSSLTRLLKKRGYDTIVKGAFELTAKRDFRYQDYGIDTNLRRATPAEIRKSKTIPHIPYKERFQQITAQLKQTKKSKRPAFIWLHMLKPHRFRGKFVGSKRFGFGKSLDGLYDSSVADTDALIPKLEGLMSEHLGDDRPTIWVIMSDHGTGLTRGKKSEQGKTLYEDQVHVPLIIKAPGIAPRSVDYLVDSAVDTSATLLDLVGVSPPAEYDGVSLVPILEGREDKKALAERLVALNISGWQGAVYKNHKLILRGSAAALYDLQSDPLERKNLADEEPDLLEEMSRRTKGELARAQREYRNGLEDAPAKKKAKPKKAEPKKAKLKTEDTSKASQ